MKHEDIKRRIKRFQTDIQAMPPGDVYKKHVLTGDCASLPIGVDYEIKNAIALHLKVEFTDVLIVGSSNLGFSIKPKRRYKAFNENSDVDVAVVDSNLFEKVWQEVFLYEKSGADWPKKQRFFKYHSKGWIRPDLLPVSDIYSFSNEWFEYFRTLPAKIAGCPFKVAAGIYHSHFFLREYQTICIEECKRGE